MSNIVVDTHGKNMIEAYGTIIKICRAMKPHATSIVVSNNKLVLMHSSVDGVYSYTILKEKYIQSQFENIYFNIPNVSSVHTKFKKTKSNVRINDFEDDVEYLEVLNDDYSTCKSLMLNGMEGLKVTTTRIYGNLVSKFDNNPILKLFEEIPSEEFTAFDKTFIHMMEEKKLCMFEVKGHPIYIAKPFLGSLKKVDWLGYRILEVDNEHNTITIQFKQIDDFGDVYSIASFLLV